MFNKNFFLTNKINIKNLSYFRSLIKLEIFNNSYCDSVGNFIRRTIFLTNFNYKIYCIKIYNINSEYQDIPGCDESTREIINNINNISLKINKSKTANLIIKKKGPCVILAKDIYSDELITIYNPDKFIANMNNSNYFFIIMKCIYSGISHYNAQNFGSFLFDSNIIYLKNYKNPIININYFIKTKFYNKKLKTLFFDIETDGTISPGQCFKNCIFYIKKYFDLIFSIIGFNKKQKTILKKNIFYFLKSVDSLGFSVSVSNYLKNNNIYLIGDLVNKSDFEIKSFLNITNYIYKEIIFILEKNNLKLNMNINYEL